MSARSEGVHPLWGRLRGVSVTIADYSVRCPDVRREKYALRSFSSTIRFAEKMNDTLSSLALPLPAPPKTMSTAELFEGAGVRPGVEAWRIENMQPVKQPRADGNMYSSDRAIRVSAGAVKIRFRWRDVRHRVVGPRARHVEPRVSLAAGPGTPSLFLRQAGVGREAGKLEGLLVPV